MPTSPVQDVTFGQAMKVSLNHFYDVLKEQVGKLESEEFFQLRAIADAIDIAEKDYPFFSYYNLLQRSDQAIDPQPPAGTIFTAASTLAHEYEKFLRKLRNYVVKANLSAEDEKSVNELTLAIDRLRLKMTDYAKLDQTNWKQYADALGFKVGDKLAQLQWSSQYGHLREIQDLLNEIKAAQFAKKTVLDKKYPEPTDREIIDAEFDFENPAMRLRYPIWPDNQYSEGNKFDLVYLASLPLGSTALFDDRRVIAFDKSLPVLHTQMIGAITGKFDKNTTESSSITTDWGSSGSANFAFIRVNANASEHTEIQDEFKKATTVTLTSAAAFRLGISYPPWFKPVLFKHKRVVDNIHDFEAFFGEKGTLLYHPTHLIVVRGFKVEFVSTQDWAFDYKKKFSASAGGGFSIFGIDFGSSNSYTNETKEHKVDKSGTTLTIEDDPSTLRFMGYVVHKNTVFADTVNLALTETLTAGIADSFV